MHLLVLFCFEKCAKIPIFIVFFENNKNWQKCPKTITFHIFKTQVDKKPVVLQPPS